MARESTPFDRRRFLKVAGTALGAGALYQVGAMAGTDPGGRALLEGLGRRTGEKVTPFSFVQLSDTHVGFQGPPNPMGTRAFEQAVAQIERDLVAGTRTVFLRRQHQMQIAEFGRLSGEVMPHQTVEIHG